MIDVVFDYSKVRGKIKEVFGTQSAFASAMGMSPVDQAAKMLGKSRQFVRVALQRGIAPFGFAVKLSGDKFSYHISPKKLAEYIGDCR